MNTTSFLQCLKNYKKKLSMLFNNNDHLTVIIIIYSNYIYITLYIYLSRKIYFCIKLYI